MGKLFLDPIYGVFDNDLFVGLVEELVSAVHVKADGNVLDARARESVINLLDALSVVANGVFVSAYDQYGQIGRASCRERVLLSV